MLTILAILQEEPAHFLLAFIMGVLGYSLTWIISFAGWRLVGHGTHRMSLAVIYGTIAIGLLFGLGLALLSHLLLDGFVLWYHTPLGPPLQIIK